MRNFIVSRRVALFATVCSMWAVAAHAQDSIPAPAPADTSGEEIEAIVVTGTAIRGVAPVGSATVNLTRDSLLEAPVRSPSDLLVNLPQGSGLGTTLAQSGGGRAGVNLRGLGNNATLLLIDGHRGVSQGVTSQISDPNTIPFAAIERVEAVTDGASAIYGSDAVAGVVNYILRRPFDGLEMTARYQNNLFDQFSGEAVGGKRWSTGGILVGASYERNDLVLRSEVPLLADDLRPFGGNDNRFQATTVMPGEAGALIIGSTVYGIPNGLNGRVPTAAEITALRNNPELIDNSKYLGYYAKRTRFSGIVRLNQSFGDLGDLNITGLYSKRTTSLPSSGDGAFTRVSVTIRPDSPYYIPGLGAGNQTVVYNFRENDPDRELMRESKEETFNLFADYRVGLFGDFDLTASGGYGVNTGCDTCQPQANTFLTGSTAFDNGPFNPYQTGPQASAEGVYGIFNQRARNQLINGSAKIDGTLIELPGGNLRIATGYEWQKLDFKFRALNSLNADTTPQISREVPGKTRVIHSIYGELFIPIFGEANAIPGFQRLDLSIAGRYDHYNDVGETTNPKFGLSWKPVDDVLFRASYGKSFRAPTLGESDARTVGQTNRVFVANGLNDPNIPVTNIANGTSLVLQRGGNAFDLAPERARIFSFGADLTPRFIPDLKVGVTYYNVYYRDRIQALPNATTILSNPATYELYKDFFVVAPQPTTCVNGGQPGLPGAPEYATYNPAYLPFLSNPNAVYSPSSNNDCQLVGVIAGGTLNLGRVKQSGLDFTVNYGVETPIGRASFNGSFSKILNLQRSLTANSPLFDAVDTIGNQVSSRGRGSLSLNHGPFTGVLTANYVGSYLNNATITVNGVKYPDTKIPSWTTFDFGLNWTSPAENGALAGLRLSLNVQNIADRNPPIVLSDTNAYDVANANVFGRIWTFEISKKF